MTPTLTPARVLVYILLIVSALFFLIPVYVLLASSLKTFAEVQDQAKLWSPPSGIYLDSFMTAWSGNSSKGLRGLSFNLLNSLNVTIPATIVSCMLGSLNGYVLSKWKFRGANVIFPMILFGMFIPYQSILIPMTRVLNEMGLGGTLLGLIFVHIIYGLPITTLIFRNYYADIPDELIEAARIEGADIFGIYQHIMLPLSMPGFVVVVIWQFTNIWNEFLFAVTILQKPELQPITVALQNLSGSQIKEWNLVMAGALIAALPTLIVYTSLGRYFVRGLLAGSVKG